MKSTTLQKPILEWQNISLNDFMNVEIEFRPAKFLYNSFFYIFWIAGKIAQSFHDVFVHDPLIDKKGTQSIGVKIEKELIELFDKAYSLEEN